MRVVCGGWRGGALAVVAAWTMCWAPASAAVTSQLQLTAGGQYVATLRDNALVDWEGADLRIGYSGSLLQFVSGTVGSLGSLDSQGIPNFGVTFGNPSPDGSGQTTLSASITHGLAATATGDFEILRLVFDSLKPGATDVSVSFATGDASLYDFVPTTASAGGTPSPVPEGHSAGLAAAALLALWLSGRQRRR